MCVPVPVPPKGRRLSWFATGIQQHYNKNRYRYIKRLAWEDAVTSQISWSNYRLCKCTFYRFTFKNNFFYGLAHLNKSLICVPMKSPGVHLAKRIDKMGMRSSDTAVIYFDEVRVPAANIIGEPGSSLTRCACAVPTLLSSTLMKFANQQLTSLGNQVQQQQV
jgi:hypothetical protein